MKLKEFEDYLAKEMNNKNNLTKNLSILKKRKNEILFFDVFNKVRSSKSYNNKEISEITENEQIKKFIKDVSIFKYDFKFVSFLYDENGEEIELDEIDNMEEILKSHIKQEDVDLSRYFWEQNSNFKDINKKVFNFTFDNISFSNQVIEVIVSVNSKEKLSKKEIECVQDNISGQLSDGWGENLEQQRILDNNNNPLQIEINNYDSFDSEEEESNEYEESDIYVKPNFDVEYIGMKQLIKKSDKRIGLNI